MMTAYDVDAKAAELGHSIIGRPVQSYLRSILAAALREARETALREVQSKIDAQVSARKKYGARGADLTDLAFCKGIVVALLAPAETETPDAS